MERGQDYQSNSFNPSMKLRDLEEKQKTLKERTLLIGQNLIETKEENREKVLELKKEVESLKNQMKKINDFIESLSKELSKFARRDDLEILSKQAKMFQPLEFVTKEELKEITNQNVYP